MQLASEGPSNIVKFMVLSKKWETVSCKNANCNPLSPDLVSQQMGSQVPKFLTKRLGKVYYL